MSGPERILVQCLGNPDRGDDAIGWAIARALETRLPPGIALQTRSGDMLALIDEWERASALVCVDAAISGAAPGTIRRIDLAEEDLPGGMAFVSSHAVGLAQAIALARTLGLAPPRIVVYAIEGASFETGAPLSDAARTAIEPAAQRIAEEARRLQEIASHA